MSPQGSDDVEESDVGRWGGRRGECTEGNAALEIVQAEA